MRVIVTKLLATRNALIISAAANKQPPRISDAARQMFWRVIGRAAHKGHDGHSGLEARQT
jgi:hypothetical protein